MKLNVYLIFLLLIISCTKKSTPEKALKEFIEYRFSQGQDKEDLLEMTTGSLNSRIEDMEGEDLTAFLKAEALQKRRLKVLLKNCEDTKCFLTYILTYSQGSGNPKDFGIEVKKIAQLEKVGETWKLSDVSNVKTYIEAHKDLEVSAEGESTEP
ncbi:MAG: hypothetical protein K9K67_01930 [Bacteriovoracaceae bacterium]|nr:hypothetical protein [Bacteriovoracaceae bacterium]